MLGSLALTALLLLPQAAPSEKAPVLSEVQKLHVQNAVQRLEIAQLRFEAARNDLVELLKTLNVPGYTLDVATMTYQKEPAKEPKK